VRLRRHYLRQTRDPSNESYGVRGIRGFNVETEIVVFQDRMFMGGLDMLRTIGIEGIYELRYLDGPTASASLPGLGGRHVEGAIVIYMSPPG
ncbi:MAG: hypothetical protein ACYTKC_23035, partial [Planctomycetota bacterium]